MPASSQDDLVDELRTWLSENWDPDLTVEQWWQLLGLAGWSAPGLPTHAYGKALSRNDSVRVQNEISAFGALGAPGGLGLLLAAPTVATHGTQEQIDLYVREIVTGAKAWCQLFSEPGAGSDLAGLTCKADLDGDQWTINGQKVWTSFGSVADLGMLIARTDPEQPKHQGITWFAMDMHQSQVDVRPLVEMTGHALFNEVFLSDAHVGNDAIIGGRGNGWAVANTTLMHERSGLGSGGGSAGGGAATPGTIGGCLNKRAGDFAPAPKKPVSKEPVPKEAGSEKKRSSGGSSGGASASPLGGGGAKLMIDLAKGNGTIQDPTIRQDLMKLHTLGELGKFNNLRLKAAKKAGQDIPGFGNLSKLAMSDIMRLTRDIGLRIIGPAGMLHAYRDEDRAANDEATGNPFGQMVTSIALWAQAPPIYGGTDQIQKNIIGERVLGLPKEPGDTKGVPFSELPKNA
ncbi:MAG: acyl-CoA dehydrogenase [Actinobacteria bacterium]|nr:acyl-CoA dehydrogenase [Actinomycetota bacterium]MSY79917.1 acyl-CoA dehydrogenase [Actinomycetota bacterium]MTA63395.1 acyl-CoA dehydrogenase [Actinomycetota bacterium]